MKGEKIEMTDKLLNDDELENVTGGAKKIVRIKFACTYCKKVLEINPECESVKCPFCKKVITLAG